jgi:hypothetical protein
MAGVETGSSRLVYVNRNNLKNPVPVSLVSQKIEGLLQPFIIIIYSQPKMVHSENVGLLEQRASFCFEELVCFWKVCLSVHFSSLSQKFENGAKR